MSKCPICDTENAPGLTVCDFCGSELPETKKCQACGEEIPKNASYCPICKNLADVKPASSSGVGGGVPMYFVALDDVGEERQDVIKVVQELAKCTFEEAREIVDGDGIVLNEVPKLEAEIAVSKLRGVGATAGMEEIDYDLDAELTDSANRGSSRSSSRSSSAGGEKSKLVAGLLALFGGGLGLHSFYLGYTTKGIMHLLLCFTGISAIWALIEAVQIFTGSMTDADGNPLV
jgi:hypothetical protein